MRLKKTDLLNGDDQRYVGTVRTIENYNMHIPVKSDHLAVESVADFCLDIHATAENLAFWLNWTNELSITLMAAPQAKHIGKTPRETLEDGKSI